MSEEFPVEPAPGPGESDPRSGIPGLAESVHAPLGPGDSVPGAVVSVNRPVRGPLRPGDSPTEATLVAMAPVSPPLGPGDAVGDALDDDVFAPPPFGPGDVAVPRPVIRRPKKRAPNMARQE